MPPEPAQLFYKQPKESGLNITLKTHNCAWESSSGAKRRNHTDSSKRLTKPWAETDHRKTKPKVRAKARGQGGEEVEAPF